VAPPRAGAQINLTYDDCGVGITNKTDACTSNTGRYDVIASFIVPSGSTAITGEEGVLDLMVAAPTVPAWWQAVTAGSCRGSAVTVLFTTPGPSCGDYFNTVDMPVGGFAYDIGFGQPNRVRIRTASAVPLDLATSFEAVGLSAGDECYAFTLRWDMTRTTGDGACAGCLVPACLVFNSLKVTQPAGVGDYVMTYPATSNIVTWQNGSNDCYVSTAPSTWGQVKSLYR
jgi:hypothetical protein